ncbi:polysaccharide biosynthesis protein [Tessaracoccus sp. MC1679]|uniref:nucleoside-diphosphate sugar epimerase/dehydratase n=1 Tax=Tessaracoccus sp. MC1679 TaxID=2760313 RepID=UPI001603B01E|nr:nucleoside-diphosphate sugar epimerase/dehydratase [Tessaracoccus sp. MC1679]MBB1514779.1 polysaccharide biosynthesis protein [Tessaracoccus sp. MC1679]
MADARRARVRWERLALAVWDTGCWAVAALALVITRYNFDLSSDQTRMVLVYAVIAMAAQVVAGTLTNLYRGRHRIASFEEATQLAVIGLAIGVALAVGFALLGPTSYPRVMTFTVPFAALILMAAGRFILRTLSTHSQGGDRAEPVLVYGAGNAGAQLGRLLEYDPDAPYTIVGYIDDDATKRNLHLSGAKVLGGRDQLVRAALERGVSTLIVALPTASRELMREINQLTEPAGIRTLVMPPTRDIVGGKVQLSNLHELDVSDLLGRAQIKTNLSEISDYLSGKVVLVTGAGGSIGSEIARQVHRFGPKELVMLDRDESGLHGTQLSIFNQGLLDTPNMVLADIRDVEALDKVFADHRPDVIFHAAALKHLPMLEQYPLEGWKTNTIGTLNLLRVSEKYGVDRFVNVSTDKAADATSVLGKTKRLAEELTAHFAHKTGRTWLSVRFGNVLGSRGSMLHTFTRQIEAGGPLTVTHPDITRYFMTIPEACELTIQAGAIGEAADVLVLDMGEPVRIMDVAKGLIARSGKDIQIIFTGLRPNEKLHEALFSDDEERRPTGHELISRVSVPPLEPAELETVDGSDPESLSRLTRQRHGEAALHRSQQEAARGLEGIELTRPEG